ncbi:lytic murein transglycosylase B [Stenoxybacter acetivorans]|uniref:lytic murein transglycosylase B n=1 Tax=Stenoxybacter acetivorans TaxID=422441 RepID=UPI00068BFB1B|nr:lytic murein transglycosylase B [Stenoxybacter acetivorans]
MNRKSLFAAVIVFLSLGGRVSAAPNEIQIRNETQGTVIAAAPESLLARADVQRFIDAQTKKGLARGELETLFANAVNKPGIIAAMDRPSTSSPWYRFRANHVSGKRIKDGQWFQQEYASVLAAVSRQYGVPETLILAILGIETHYGTVTGSFRVADALTTLGFNYPRRAEFFQQELAEFLQLVGEEKRSPFDFQGSYAGAMGMPQFMPSSYRKWAVDWDKDGKRDIWNNVGDTAASIANYMKQHGWQTGKPMAVRVGMNITPQLQTLIDDKTELKYTAGQWRRMGVFVPMQIADADLGVLYQLEVTPGEYEYWLGLNNFYTVWQYNHSRYYVHAVRDIANALGGEL